ncbi:MAG: dickkopf-related protein, partial [Deltaproteobacteria bacterium]|nr:dickkopf-related protein [Deltaproteobacteria bacterium]
LWRNGINADAENGVPTVIPGGTWNYVCNVTQSENYTNASDSYPGYVVDRNTTSITSFIATPVPATVGNETNVSCAMDNPQVEITIYQNGSPVANNTAYVEYLANLSAGDYEFICNTTGNENYTSVAGTPRYYTVDKIATALTLSIDQPSWTVVPNTLTNVSCDSSNPVVWIELYMDDAPMDSGYGHVEDAPGTPLAIGSYVYVCNTTGAENYTADTDTQTLTVRRPSEEGGQPEECVLSIVMDGEIPVGVPADIEIRRSTGTNPSNALVEIWRNVAGAVHEEFRTDGSGHITFTPSETGGYMIASFLSGCTDADDTFSAYAPTGEATATFEPGCEGSVVTVLTTVCTGGETGGGGFLECMDVPAENAGVSIYRCPEDWDRMDIRPEEVCTELIGTFTTDENGEVATDARDGHVRIVVDLRVATHATGTTIYGDLPSSEDCPPPTQEISINFDPGCEGSTVTVTGTVCEEGTLMQDLEPGTIAYQQCEEDRSLSGMHVQIYCCPENREMMDVMAEEACTDLVDSGTTDSAGMFVTDAMDCEAMVFVERPPDTLYEDSWIFVNLPTTQECAECLADSDCPEGYVCRDNECSQPVIPPDQRRCASDGECTQGYRCSGGQCTQIRACASDQDCQSGQGCLEGVCYTDEEIDVITGGEGGVEGGGIVGMLKNISDVIIRSSWLILLLIMALLLFWFFYWKRRKKKKPLTEEEMIGKEQEFGTRPPVPPRPPRR